MIGYKCRYESFTEEQAAERIRNRCRDCEIQNDCSGSDEEKCAQITRILIRKFGKEKPEDKKSRTMKTIRDFRDALDAMPGLPRWESAVRHYAVSLLETYVMDRRLSIYDGIDAIQSLTEEDLLKGAPDWQAYSEDGNALLWTCDLSMRLFGTKTAPVSPQALVRLQGEALSQAAARILNALSVLETEKEVEP